METNFENIERAHNVLARERVLGDLKTLARDAENLLKATASDMGEKYKDARTRLAGTLERAMATCNEVQKQTVATAKAAAHKADTTIRDHPYESIGIAFGLGLLIGVLVARK